MKTITPPLKFLIFHFAFIVCASSMLSQSPTPNFCKTPTDVPDSDCDYTNFTASTDPAYLATFEPVVFKIFFWEIRDDNGFLPQGSLLIADFEKEALDIVAAANQLYNPYNVFFKYVGFDEIRSTDLTLISSSGLIIDAIGDEIYVEQTGDLPDLDDLRRADAYNVYVSGNTGTGGGAAYDYHYPLHVQSRSSFVNKLDHAVHEMGHSLGLYHSNLNFFFPANYLPQINVPGCEAVTRDDTNINFNANSHGDFVADTAAAPLFRSEEYYELYWEYMDPITNPDINDHQAANAYAGANFDTEFKYLINCEYTGLTANCMRQDSYQIFYEDIHSLMTYRPDECDDDLLLTTGQAIRIRESIDLDCQGALTPAINSVDGIASLFEPYKGEYYFAGSAPPIQPTFQPGFDYVFIDCSCDCNQPRDYEPIPNFTYNILNVVANYDASFQDYDAITHPNHSAIRIVQLEDDGVLPQRCYDNTNRAPSGGNLTRFNDGIFNANVTLTPQDSLQINNPQFINTLQPGLYNIRKEFDDGTTEETNVLKQGNN